MVATYLIGFCFFYGIGAQKDTRKGFYLFQEAGELVYQNRKYAAAQNMVGYCYRNGEGVERDAEKIF